jgi:hypothetical protein
MLWGSYGLHLQPIELFGPDTPGKIKHLYANYFAFCVDPRCISAAPAALDRYLAALPAMSLIPFAPFA